MAANSMDAEISLVKSNNRKLLRARLAESLLRACTEVDSHATVVDSASQDRSADMVATDFPRTLLLRNSEAWASAPTRC